MRRSRASSLCSQAKSIPEYLPFCFGGSKKHSYHIEKKKGITKPTSSSSPSLYLKEPQAFPVSVAPPERLHP
jgi:hypothetical protein